MIKNGAFNICLLKYYPVLAGILIGIWFCAGSVSEAKQKSGSESFQPVNKHVCKINKDDMLLLAENGKANVEIVVPEPATPTARFAAKELKTFLDQALGSDIKILRERSGATPAIILGDNRWSRAWGVNAGALPQDAFVIKRLADAIIIVGRDAPYKDPAKYGRRVERATLFGVYDFLERFVGVRFYFPGEMGTVVPKLKELRIPQVEIYEEPDFIIRNVSWSYATWYHPFKDAPAKRAEQMTEMYRLRGSTQYIPCCHGLARLGLAERFGANHPEYFSLWANGKRDTDMNLPGHHGHLCYSTVESSR